MYTWGVECFEGNDGAALRRLADRVKYRRFSGDCYAYGLLALGFVDLVVEDTMNPWDYAALVPIIEGAGGRITDWDDRPLDLRSDCRVLASGDPGLHAAAIGLLRG
jgi:fructose-1,6-bisphosphatase/inositol monophosphatase family enzyme